MRETVAMRTLGSAFLIALSIGVASGSAQQETPPTGPDLQSANVCASNQRRLCLQEKRFQVSITWRDPRGNEGVGTAIELTDDTGTFWFFDDQNLELMVKVLDGRSLNGNFWVFYGSLSNVAFELTVVDTETGASNLYRNPQGTFASVGDTAALPGSSRPTRRIRSAQWSRTAKRTRSTTTSSIWTNNGTEPWTPTIE